jgi:hypothetical protein
MKPAMKGVFQAMVLAMAGAISIGPSAAGTAPASPTGKVESAALTADEIVDRYVAASGGAEAWKKIETMSWEGHVETGPGGISKAPFMLMFRRPDATRFEVMAEGQRSVRIFDGKEGWKWRPTAGGTPAAAKDYSADEVSFARDAGGLDGPLHDSGAKGVKVTLEGADSVDGRPAYRLGLRLPSGRKRTEWIDAQSFLELRYDREMHDMQGRGGTVAVYNREFRTVEGLTLPVVIETGSGNDVNRMVIEKVAINPILQNNLFTKPMPARGKHNGILIDTTSAR